MNGKLITAGALALAFLLATLLLKREERIGHQIPASNAPPILTAKVQFQDGEFARKEWVRTPRRTISAPPEQVVRDKIAKFAQSRRKLATALGQKHGVSLTPEIEKFFDAVESGDWDRIEATFKVINGGDSSAGPAQQRSPEVNKMWPAIIDAFGAAEQAHLLPAQTLLDYGYSILDSLRPGMVYVGGTDSSRWVPALLNDTEAGDPHIVITQNGLADASYLDYVRLQFDGRMNTITPEESEKIFAAYMEDARKRLEHDQSFPDEPKQLRHGEEVKMVDGKVSVSGRVAVFDINERLLDVLLEKNPGVAFAVGESFPLKGTYSDAVPLGPLMELRVGASEKFTSDRASESLDYWRETAEYVLAHPETSTSDEGKRIYSHDAVAAGNLLAAHQFSHEAEATYELARRLWPANPEPHAALAQLYEEAGRKDEAQRLLQEFVRKYPEQQKALKDSWALEVNP